MMLSHIDNIFLTSFLISIFYYYIQIVHNISSRNKIISTYYTYYYLSLIAHKTIRRSQLSQIAIGIRETCNSVIT